MAHIYSGRLNEKWLKAAVMGSLWAAFEIIIGSFLHNLRVPLAGTILSSASVGLIIAFIQVWNTRGLVWRAGLVAALLKSLSPSAVIIGPMTGIFSEALIIEIMILLLGRNLFGYMVAGALAVSSALIHKVITLLIIYGFDLVIILEELYRYVSKEVGLVQGDPLYIIIGVLVVYFVTGSLAALLGFIAGRKALRVTETRVNAISPGRDTTFFSHSNDKRSSPWFLLLHLLCIVGCLYMINALPLQFSIIPSLAYAGYCFIAYRRSMRSFRKPSFWIWFMVITILAAVFWNGLSKGEIWDFEGLIVGLKMNLRAVVVLTGFAALSQELHNPVIRIVLYHHGFANLYHAIELAFSVLPGMIGSLPGMKKLFRSPVNSLGLIIRKAATAYPAMEAELKKLNPVIIITGDTHQGKTGFLVGLIGLLKKEGLKLSGFIARAVDDDKERIGYNLEDILTGERVQFIRKSMSEGAFRQGKYYFGVQGIEFGKEILRSAGRTHEDLIVIDEVGPVEMKGRGWAGEIERLVSTVKKTQLWVVRRSLLKKAMRQWNAGDIMVIDIEKDTPDSVLEDVKAFIQSN